ncbi:unnamed protein product [Haemonchus placei]|uniref:Uncharacterized protein n=1 Tax=Haemonchus placei TaxID=6290 RepID=A0A0N4WYV1_HAEPC|nr:unnamed protein product [Haemonchus placei]
MGSHASEFVLVIVCTFLIFGAEADDEDIKQAFNGIEDSVETDNENSLGDEPKKELLKEVENINKGKEAVNLTEDPDKDKQAVPYEKKNEEFKKFKTKEKGSVKKKFKREDSVETEPPEISTRELAETSPCIFNGSGEATSTQDSGSDKPVTELTEVIIKHTINSAQKDAKSSLGISKGSGSEVTTIQDSTYTSPGIVNENGRGTSTHDTSSSKQGTEQPSMKTKRSRKPARRPKTKPGILEVSTENIFMQDRGHGEQVTERRGEETPKSRAQKPHYYNTYDDEDEAGRADFGVEVWNPENSEDPHAADSDHVPDDPAMTPIDLFSLNFGIAIVIISYMFHFF